MMLFDLRGSQEMAREPTSPDINTSWLGPQTIAVIFTGDFIFHVQFIFRPGLQGFPMLLGMYPFLLTLMAALT